MRGVPLPVSALGSLGAVALATALLRLLGVASPTTVALTFLLVVLFAASLATLTVAAATSIAAMLALNFFFMPPVGTFTIADPHNWVALVAFLAVAIVASHLSSTARARARPDAGAGDGVHEPRGDLVAGDSHGSANRGAPRHPVVRRLRGDAP